MTTKLPKKRTRKSLWQRLPESTKNILLGIGLKEILDFVLDQIQKRL